MKSGPSSTEEGITALSKDSRRKFLAQVSSFALAGWGALNGCATHRRTPLSQPLPAASTASLRAAAAAHGRLAGFALSMAGVRESEEYRRAVREQCSIAVAENAMKWAALRPAPDRYFFDDADELVRFTESNGIRMRGHNLCWHRQLPDWFASTATRQNARSLLTSHIRTVTGRYAGRMHSWDVVNEAVQVSDGRPDGLRVSPWLSLIGEDYIELAFRTAREADPATLLTYNDYGIESESAEDSQKRAAVLLLLRRLRQRNVPLDGVGIQSHLTAGPSHRYGQGLRDFVRECRELGLEVFLTELDVDDRNLASDVSERDRMVAETYSRYLDVVQPESNVRALLTWGVGDRQTWLNHEKPRKDGLPQRPLLFDDKLQAKPAFESFLGCLRKYPSGGTDRLTGTGIDAMIAGQRA